MNGSVHNLMLKKTNSYKKTLTQAFSVLLRVDVSPGASVAAVVVVIGARVGFNNLVSLKTEQWQEMPNFA